jgi:hypothetical protein
LSFGEVALPSSEPLSQMIPLQGTVASTTADTITLECLEIAGPNGQASYPSINAVRLAEINGS